MIDVELFAGAGCASEGLASIGVQAVGIEWDRDCCATRRAAGHPTIRADLSTYPWRHLRGRVRLMHGSPPCQPFSTTGAGVGAADRRDGTPWMLRAIDEARPQLVTVENVPGLTHAKHAAHLGAFLGAVRGLGYDVDRRVLCVADFGVPQTRRRLIIVARRDGAPIRWPNATHTDGGGLFLKPWVSMAEAVGWGWDTQWTRTRPATTVNCDPRISAPGHHNPAVSGSQQADAIRVTLDELAALQAYPAGYPFHGNRTSIARQIGNGLPGPLIAAVVKANLP